ncbi:sulfatase-like hydrolase/transferase [Epibacterium ulvae]|uniref:sulfatase-like hydrolase/transferase n=1 Tax=Epibacterium ulvae TaxID=1156985 RepID=UPI001BFC7440|nr:sulfatase-like hydrolase/transferase [Epibacterium ulvae]MBT8153320.1 sulfatase-like hydrolase/transferase [Epibacterium ulvae]
MPRPRNILFVLIDQLRADAVFGALADHVKLPNLRAFQRDAVSFTRNFTVVNPCGPSRASILTGQYAMNHRAVRNGTPLRHDIPNIAGEMRKAGYLPMLFGYTDTSNDPRISHPNDPRVQSYEYHLPDFHEVLEMRLEESFPWRAHLRKRGYHFDNYWDLYRPVAPGGGAPKPNDPAIYAAEDSDTAFLTDQFLERMRGYEGQSWFAHLTYIRPHPPLVAPTPYNRMYDPATLLPPQALPTPADEAAVHPFCAAPNADIASFVEGFPDLEPSEENIQTLRAIYLGLASEVDHHIGRIMAYLRDSGQYDDTLIVLSADHGEMLGDRHAWGKQSVYDSAYHTPLMIRMPNNAAQAGAHVSALTESIDLMPTILDWVGQEIPNSVDGRSLMPLLRGEQPSDWRQYSFSELDFGDPITPTAIQQALGTTTANSCLAILRDARFTLVQFAADLPPLLFDQAAAGEMVNVAGDLDYQSDLFRLTQQMLRHKMTYQDHTLSFDMITKDGPRRSQRHATGAHD